MFSGASEALCHKGLRRVKMGKPRRNSLAHNTFSLHPANTYGVEIKSLVQEARLLSKAEASRVRAHLT